MVHPSAPLVRSARPRSGRAGGGLVELMIAMVLIGIIASIAIPQYLRLHRKAMRAEPLPNLRSIGVAEQAYFVADGSWVVAGPNPEASLGPRARPFDATRADWRPLGWFPDRDVRCTYSATLMDHGSHVRAEAVCDLDGDREYAILRYEVPAGDQQGTFLDLYPERF